MPTPVPEDDLAARLDDVPGIYRPVPQPDHKIMAMLRQIQANSPKGTRWAPDELPTTTTGRARSPRSVALSLRREAKRHGWEITVLEHSSKIPDGHLEAWMREDFRRVRATTRDAKTTNNNKDQ